MALEVRTCRCQRHPCAGRPVAGVFRSCAVRAAGWLGRLEARASRFEQRDERGSSAGELEAGGELDAEFVAARSCSRAAARGVGEERRELRGVELGADGEQRFEHSGARGRIASIAFSASPTPGSSGNCASRSTSSCPGARWSCGSSFATRAALAFGSSASEASRRASTGSDCAVLGVEKLRDRVGMPFEEHPHEVTLELAVVGFADFDRLAVARAGATGSASGG